MKIIVFSDAHIGGKFNEDTWVKGIETINKEDSDYVVFTGDLTDQGTVADYELAKNYLSSIKKDVLLIPGNHDVKNVGDLLWEEYIGPRFFVHVDAEKKVKILGLDSNEPDKNTGRMGPKAIKRIYEEFQDLSNDWIKILVFHHQTLPIKFTGRERSALVDAGDTIKAIMDCDINLVLNGHRHISNVYTLTDGDAKTLIVNCGTISCRKTRYKEQYSITSIEIDETQENAKVDIMLLHEPKLKWNTSFQGSLREQKVPKHEFGNLIGTIIQIGNTEFAKGKSFDIEGYTEAIQLINHIECDLVVHNGDVTNNSYRDEFEMAKNFLGLIEHSMVVVPGPRDYYPLGRELYRSYIGSSENEFETGSMIVLGLNSCIMDEKIGRLGRSTSQEVATRLQSDERLTVIAFHHNIIPLSQTKHESELQDAGDVLSIIVDNKINLVLTGAKNKSGCWQVNDTVFVNAGTISSRNVNTVKGNSFNVIQVYQTKKGKYYRIMEYFYQTKGSELIGEFHIYDKI